MEAEILQRLGDPDAGLRPTMFIHRRCARLLECLPSLQHDPNRSEDVLKVDADEEGIGGDDAADACRYLVATKGRTICIRKLRLLKRLFNPKWIASSSPRLARQRLPGVIFPTPTPTKVKNGLVGTRNLNLASYI